MLLQKEMEVLQDYQLTFKHPFDFAEFVKKIEFNVEKSLLSRRNRLQMREKMRESWLLKSKIIPPSFAKIGQQNQHPTPKGLICSPSIFNSPQKFAATQHEICSNLCETSLQHSAQKKPIRTECKTSYDGLRPSPSPKGSKSSWKLEFRRDELNVLKYQRKSEEDITDAGEQSAQKGFKVRKVHRKFEELKLLSQPYRNNLSTEEKSAQFCKRPYRTLDSSSVYRHKSPQ